MTIKYMVRDFSKSSNQPKEMALIICYSVSCYCFSLTGDWNRETMQMVKEISDIPFRTEKEDYLRR